MRGTKKIGTKDSGEILRSHLVGGLMRGNSSEELKEELEGDKVFHRHVGQNPRQVFW